MSGFNSVKITILLIIFIFFQANACQPASGSLETQRTEAASLRSPESVLSSKPSQR